PWSKVPGPGRPAGTEGALDRPVRDPISQISDLPAVTLDDDAVGPVLAPSLKLVVLSGKDQGREIYLEAGQPMRVGSSPENLLTLRDRRVSRHHVSFEVTPTGVKVIDLGSRNGSFH